MWALLWWVGCVPVLEDRSPYVDAPRLLAVRAVPAEVSAGAEVTLEPLFADGAGRISPAPLDWSFCTALKPLAELGPVAASCLDAGSEALVALDGADPAVGAVPTDACSRFGPNPPPPVDGEPAGRPTDPDITGGFYQPALAFEAGEDGPPTLAPVRVRCGLANVAQETYIDWNRRYRNNTAPRPAGVVVDTSGGAVEVPWEGDGAPVEVEAGEEVAWTVAWAECPEVAACGDGVCSPDEDVATCETDCATPLGCSGAETYIVYDPAVGANVERREAVSAGWFTSGGALSEPRTGRSGDDRSNATSTTWTAPSEPGEVWLAVVLRDERGGVDFGTWRVVVTP